jgi:hypothetical protein
MRVIAFFICLFFVLVPLARAEIFIGHIQYQVLYHKPYSHGPIPREKRIDLYVKDHLKLIIVDSIYNKKNVVAGYLFDDNKSILTQINYIDKTFTPIPYNVIPNTEIVEEAPLIKNPRALLNRSLKGQYLVDKKNNLHYEAWYADITTKPLGMYKIDTAHIVEKSTGKIALLLIREIIPGTKITYKAIKMEKIDPSAILAVPKDYKISKQAVDK